MAEHTPDTPERAPLATTRIVAGQKSRRKIRGVEILGIAVLLGLIGAGAAVASRNAAAHDAGAAPAGTSPAATLKLGYFANLTHAPALIGVDRGLLAERLGDTELSTQVFNAGPAAIEALNAGAIDAAYLGPSPAINSFEKSGGASLKIVAGATSGGAQLVVRPEITSPEQLRGTVLATPQLGGTQDVALRFWLSEQGFATTPSGGGDVTINPTDNAGTLQLFREGKIDGAWLPEPWASRLVLEAGASVLVNEAELWEGGDFTTTLLVVNQSFLAAHPETVEALLAGHLDAIDWLNAHRDGSGPDSNATTLNAALQAATGKALGADVIERALTQLAFSADPLAASYPVLLEHGVTAGVSEPANLQGIFELTALNRLLAERGAPAVSAAELGSE